MAMNPHLLAARKRSFAHHYKDCANKQTMFTHFDGERWRYMTYAELFEQRYGERLEDYVRSEMR